MHETTKDISAAVIKNKLRRRIRLCIIFFISVLIIVGITTFPLEKELQWMINHDNIFPAFLAAWIGQIYTGIKETNTIYPFISYGTDWLAYAHIVIALLFTGPYRDPVKNKWIIDWAILACLIIIPVAILAGSSRSIPVFHICIDCAFGIFGILPLVLIRRDIRRLENVERSS